MPIYSLIFLYDFLYVIILHTLMIVYNRLFLTISVIKKAV